MNKEELKQYIDQNIYENEDGDITGEALNDVLKAVVDDGGTKVVANPEDPQPTSEPLMALRVGGTDYAIPENGSNVVANPTGDATQTLNKIKIGETIYTAPQGPQGEPGEDGQDGQPGAPGPANTLTIGTVTDGEQASASIEGDAPNQTLNLVLPKGEQGDKGDKGDNAVNPFKGYYMQASDLTVIDPPTEGNDGDFIIVADYSGDASSIYRWNGSGWTDTGKDADPADLDEFISVSTAVDKITELENKTEEITFEKKTLTRISKKLGYILNVGTSYTIGSLQQNGNYIVLLFDISGYERVRFLSRISTTSSSNGCAFYSEDLDYSSVNNWNANVGSKVVKTLHWNVGEEAEVEERVEIIPEGAKYFGVTLINSSSSYYNESTFYCVVEKGDNISDIVKDVSNKQIDGLRVEILGEKEYNIVDVLNSLTISKRVFFDKDGFTTGSDDTYNYVCHVNDYGVLSRYIGYATLQEWKNAGYRLRFKKNSSYAIRYTFTAKSLPYTSGANTYMTTDELVQQGVFSQCHFNNGEWVAQIEIPADGEYHDIKIPIDAYALFLTTAATYNNTGNSSSASSNYRMPNEMYTAETVIIKEGALDNLEKELNLKIDETLRSSHIDIDGKDPIYSEGGVLDDFEETMPNRFIARVIGNTLRPLNVSTNENDVEIAQTHQELDCQKRLTEVVRIKWTPKKDVPNNSGKFNANTDVIGLPYSSVKELNKFIGFDVSIYTFMTAVNNQYSLLYTEKVGSNSNSISIWGNTYNGTNAACYFGTVCSELTSYASGDIIYWGTSENAWVEKYLNHYVRVFPQNAQGLRIGDIYHLGTSGHNRIIYKLKRDSRGNVVGVLMSESAGTHIQLQNWLSVTQFENLMRREEAIIYRNLNLYKVKYIPNPFVTVNNDLSYTNNVYEYNNDICTYAGDKASFREGERIVLNYNLNDDNNFEYDSIEVYKDSGSGYELLDTYVLSEIDQSQLPESQRNHALDLGTSLPHGKYKARLSNNGIYSEYTYWEILETNVELTKNNDGTYHIAFSSNNAKPIIYALYGDKARGRGRNILDEDSIKKGYVDVNLVELRKQQYNDLSIIGVVLKVHFAGEYGRVTSEGIEIIE